MQENGIPLAFKEHPFDIRNGEQGIAIANDYSIVIIPLDVEFPSMVTLWFEVGLFRAKILKTTAQMRINGRPGQFSRQYVFSGSPRNSIKIFHFIANATNVDWCDGLDTIAVQRHACERYIAKNPLAQQFALARARRPRITSPDRGPSLGSHLLAAGAGYVVGDAIFGEDTGDAGDYGGDGEDYESID